MKMTTELFDDTRIDDNNDEDNNHQIILCEQTWTIENFTEFDRCNLTNSFVSACFGDDSRLRFSLRLVPKHLEDGDRWISIYLELHSPIIVPRTIAYTFAIINPANAERLYTRDGQARFDQLIRCLGFPRYITRDQLLMCDGKYVIEDRLVIYCQIKYSNAEPPVTKISSSDLLSNLDMIDESKDIDLEDKSSLNVAKSSSSICASFSSYSSSSSSSSSLSPISPAFVVPLRSSSYTSSSSTSSPSSLSSFSASSISSLSHLSSCSIGDSDKNKNVDQKLKLNIYEKQSTQPLSEKCEDPNNDMDNEVPQLQQQKQQQQLYQNQNHYKDQIQDQNGHKSQPIQLKSNQRDRKARDRTRNNVTQFGRSTILHKLMQISGIASSSSCDNHVAFSSPSSSNQTNRFVATEIESPLIDFAPQRYRRFDDSIIM